MEKNTMPTVGSLLQWAVSYLKVNSQWSHESLNHRLEAELLLSHLLKCTRTKLHVDWDKAVNATIPHQLEKLVQKRSQGYPLQYLTGVQNFMSLDFQVTEGVLIPRSDTEILVEKAIELGEQLLKDDNKNQSELLIADVCTGSGAIGLSVAHYLPMAKVLLSDISQTAVQVATANREKLQLTSRVTIAQGDLLHPVAHWLKEQGATVQLDLLLSNPPYISQEEWEEVAPDVKQYEPLLALDGGTDGLHFYRQLIAQGSALIKAGGYIMVEIGHNQGTAVEEIFAEADTYHPATIIQDYSHRDRVVMAKRK